MLVKKKLKGEDEKRNWEKKVKGLTNYRSRISTPHGKETSGSTNRT